MTSCNKTKVKEQVYISPDLQVLEIELRQNILAASGEVNVDGLKDFESEYW